MKSKLKWSTKHPTRPGTYKMRDMEREYTIFVQKHGTEMAFREKGQPFLYSFNGTDNCMWAKCK